MPYVVVLFALLFAGITLPAVAGRTPQTLPRTNAAMRPYNLVGQIFFNSGGTDFIGSGTVIRASSVLTAGHNVYDPDSGWSTDIEFRRGAYGNAALSVNFASRILVLGGYRESANRFGVDSVRTFASDAAGLIFKARPAGGAAAKYTANVGLLQSPTVRVGLGYGAEFHSGDFPLFVTPTNNFRQVFGSYWETPFVVIEGGMSGGPLFSRQRDGSYAVTAIIVSSSGPPQAGGVRIVDPALVRFIQVNLR